MAARAIALTVLMVAGSQAVVTAAAGVEPNPTAYRAGIGLLNKGMVDAAAEELRTYLSGSPTGVEALNARYALAVCYSRQGKHAEALAELDQIQKGAAFEWAADAGLLRGICLQAKGDDAGAVTALRGLIAEHKTFGKLDQALVMLGESLYRQGKHEEAIAAVKDGLAKSPRGASAGRGGLVLAMSLSATGEFAAGAERAAAVRTGWPEVAATAALVEAQCRDRLGQGKAAAELYAVAAASKDDAVRGEALLGMAQMARAAGKVEDAAALLAKVAGGTAEFAGRVAMERGRIEFDRKKYAEAEKIFAGVDADSVAADAALWRGRAIAAGGDATRAERVLAEAMERFKGSPRTGDLALERAAVLAGAGRDAEAMEAYGQAGGPDAVVGAAWAAMRLKKYDEVIAMARGFKGPEGHAGRESMALLVAECEFAAGRHAAAAAAYGRFVEAYPKSGHVGRAVVRRGLALRAAGDAGAKAALETAAKAEGVEAGLRIAVWSALGEDAMAGQDWAGGERWFAKVAESTTASEVALDALLRQGICMARRGEQRGAVELFERVAREASGGLAVRARYEAGSALAAAGDPAGAEKAFAAVVEMERSGTEKPLTAFAQRGLAAAAAKRGDSAKAAELLGAIGTPEAAYDAAQAWMSAGRYAEAEAALVRYINSGPAKAQADAAAVQRAVAVSRQGKGEAALKLLEALPMKDLDAESAAAAGYERAVVLRGLGRAEDATAALKAVLERGAGRREAYAASELADLLAAKGAHADALAAAERAGSAAGALPEAEAKMLAVRIACQRASALLGLGRGGEAATVMRGVGEDGKGEVRDTVLLLRGEAELAAGSARDAAAAFEQAGKSGVAAVREAARLRVGEAWAAARVWEKAEQSHQAFLDEYPKSDQWFRAAFGVGMARENLGRHDAAIEAYRRVATTHTGATAARAQFQIGECLYAQKKYEAAVAEFVKTDVLFAVPEWSAAALYEAGRCLEELKKPQEAAKQFAEVVTRFPETQWAKLAKERSAAVKDAAKAAAAVPGR